MPAMFKLDHKGVRELLRSDDYAHAVDEVARQVADAARSRVPADMPIEVSSYKTDRRAARVTIAHPAGAAEQAKHGALTAAAAAVGLDVKAKR
ncbi:MAG TPA: hypothetical protein VFL65_00840 [Jatrophihabitans sp.]|nr:hypothetical protein [Jatrophihabitans sp.]